MVSTRNIKYACRYLTSSVLLANVRRALRRAAVCPCHASRKVLHLVAWPLKKKTVENLMCASKQPGEDFKVKCYFWKYTHVKFLGSLPWIIVVLEVRFLRTFTEKMKQWKNRHFKFALTKDRNLSIPEKVDFLWTKTFISTKVFRDMFNQMSDGETKVFIMRFILNQCFFFFFIENKRNSLIIKLFVLIYIAVNTSPHFFSGASKVCLPSLIGERQPRSQGSLVQVERTWERG